jgi:hypothetical protein
MKTMRERVNLTCAFLLGGLLPTSASATDQDRGPDVDVTDAEASRHARKLRGLAVAGGEAGQRHVEADADRLLSERRSGQRDRTGKRCDRPDRCTQARPNAFPVPASIDGLSAARHDAGHAERKAGNGLDEWKLPEAAPSQRELP